MLVLAVALLAAGCSSSTPLTRGKVVPWTVKITKVTPASVEVDLIGINKPEHDYWATVNLDEYWLPGSPVRQAAFDRKRAVTTKFDTSKTFTLDAKDPIWKTWAGYGSYEVVLLANLPGMHHSAADARRLFVLLGKGEWQAKDRTLEFEILENQIRPLTPPKP